MAQKKKIHILDLSTAIERPTVKVDGESYELLQQDELSLAQGHRLSTWGKKLMAFFNQKDEAEETEYEQMRTRLHSVTCQLLQAPEEIVSKLTDMQKLRVIEAVFPKPAETKNSATPSPGSSDSMEEIPKAG